MVELIVAMTLLSMLLAIGLNFLSRTSKQKEKYDMIDALEKEGDSAFKKVISLVEQSAIDYEEYYSRYVLQMSVAENARTFGANYGSYHTAFFNPVTDYDTGTHPYGGYGQPPEAANALCDPLVNSSQTDCATNPAYFQVEELFLLNSEGNRKTIFAVEAGALAMVELVGSDTDQDGLMDTWSCASSYTCTGMLPNPSDLSDGTRDNNDFIPIVPTFMTIDTLQFILSPNEDPFKGYNETSSTVFNTVQIHPNVTIYLEAHYETPSPAAILGEEATFTRQETLSTGVMTLIPAYAPN